MHPELAMGGGYCMAKNNRTSQKFIECDYYIFPGMITVGLNLDS